MGARESVPARGPTLRVRQVRSGIGYAVDQRATLRALGLGKLGRVRTLPDNPQIRGMLAKIPHLVRILPPGDGPGPSVKDA